MRTRKVELFEIKLVSSNLTNLFQGLRRKEQYSYNIGKLLLKRFSMFFQPLMLDKYRLLITFLKLHLMKQ